MPSIVAPSFSIKVTQDMPVQSDNPTPPSTSSSRVLPVKPKPFENDPLTSSPSTPPAVCGNDTFSVVQAQ